MTKTFQLTPPHGGRHSYATPFFSSSSFNSRPRMGGDKKEEAQVMTRNRFNSRPRMGGDELYRDHGSEDKVSTHAPAWGATSFGAHVSGSIDGFNSRPRMGGDGVVVGLSIKLWFQLTPPHGGRLHRRVTTP